MSAFFGMRGTGDWVTDQRPKNYREMYLRLYPNGTAPLTALLSKMSSQSTDDPEFAWWTKTLATQGGAITATYTDVGLSNAYSSGGVSGDTLYVNMAEAVADELRIGHEVLLRYSGDFSVDCVGEVTAVVKNGASSYAAVKLLEADDNSSSYDLSDADRILIIGNINAEGADTPDEITYDPTKYYNYTQIFRTPVSITGTAAATRLRTGPQNRENRREGLEIHMMEIEKAFLFGVRTESTGSNGKPKRTTWGLIPIIRTNTSSDNISDYVTNTSYSGQTWLQGGKDWFDAKLASIFRFGARRKLAFTGYSAMLGINRLAETYGTLQIKVGQGAYGIKVVDWETVFGTITMINHPLFSYESTNAGMMAIFEPKLLKYRYMNGRDTKYLKDRQDNGIDGTIDEYLTEAGLEFHHPNCFGLLTGVGEDNTV